MPRELHRRQGSISIIISGLCVSCGVTSSSHHTALKSGQISTIGCKMLPRVDKKRQYDCAIVVMVVFQSNLLVRHLNE